MRALPPEIQLEIEELVSDLGGDSSLAARWKEEASGDLRGARLKKLRRRLLALPADQKSSA
jgi:hypothetical protein